jgi:hypothetical protein
VLDNGDPALLVTATAGPRTVYEGGMAMCEEWPGSRLLTVPGARQHGLYGEYGNACVDRRVNAGELPDRDVTCPR